MRILLRILAVLIGLAVLRTTWIAWDLAAHFHELAASGAYGILTLFGWALNIAVGPFAVVQLWRGRENGRLASIALAAFAFIYYASGLILFRPESMPNALRLVVPITGNLLLLALLVSPAARRTCADRPLRPAAG